MVSADLLDRNETRSPTAAEILELLRVRHSKDVFVDECKDGPTHYTQHVRMDAWVMPRSWANPATTAYEIKVSRSDFLSDHKWPAYLPLCHQFYFVCPAKLIAVEECPADAGLLWVTTTATRLYTKKKAPYRNVEIPEELWRYVLMCRAKIGHELQPADPQAVWNAWLDQKREAHDLGYRVRGRIAEIVEAANKRAERAESAVGRYESVREAMREVGLDPDARMSSWEVRSRVREAVDGIKPGLDRMLERTADQIELLRKALIVPESEEVPRSEPQGQGRS